MVLEVDSNTRKIFYMKDHDVIKSVRSCICILILTDLFSVQGDDSGLDYYAVAVVRKDNPGFDVETLGQKKACHTGVGRAAGWVYPVSSLIEMEIMGIAECNVPVKSAAAFFGPMCAPNGLARFYNPFGKKRRRNVCPKFL